MKKIDELLNNVTMYRLLTYGLAALAGLGIVFALIGRLSFSPTMMIISLILLVGASYLVEKLFSRLWKIPSNAESSLITALILFLILQPAVDLPTALTLLLAGAIASASKYLISWNGKHLFNPAAVAAAFLSFTALQPAAWWIGSSAFWPFTLVLGLIIVHKIRRFPMVLTFGIVSLVLQVFLFTLNGQPVFSNIQNVLLVSPLLFLASVMLTEPATMPPRRDQQLIFATLVAALYITGWKIGPVHIYPEVALLLGNIYAFVVSPKFKTELRLKEIQRISDHVYHYIFQSARKMQFLPGQYMEWTLANVPYDSRGNRRSFTIASSPTEDTIQVGLKYHEPSSTYKETFKSLQIGDAVHVSQLAGSFTIDGYEKQKLAFIAGGIGITPFRSMIKYLVDNQIHCDITLLYAVSDVRDLAYLETFKQAATFGVTFIPISTQADHTYEGVVTTKLNEKAIATLVPDYAARRFYLSGPDTMVRETKRQLRHLNVHRVNIKTDYFSGY
jgi:ferredoxin-NADP reductase/Na+-translocating ferredoxin:NAD+ oxidoreductase RnfD subunit